MIRYLIKNNFKLMYRNTWSIVTMLVAPILVIAVLSSAFAGLMKSYEGVDEFSVGYRTQMAGDSIMEAVREAGEQAGILFYEYPEGEIKEVMQKNELAGFVEFSEDEYTMYTSEDYKVEGITLEYFMHKAMNEGVNAALQVEEKPDITPAIEHPEYMSAIDSVDYYGIAFIVYFCWCGIICATGVLSNEKKYGIERRFRVSDISEIKNYLGKFIPIVLTATAGIGIATGVTILLFDIHWGKPLWSFCIILLMILAQTALGLMFYNISNSLVITIILQFTVAWFMGFVGGSFETYMFSAFSDSIKHLSPIYHGTRALVELSCVGESSYVGSALIYALAITVICSVIAVLAGTIRKRGKA